MSYEGPSIKATRILGDRKPDKQYSVANLLLSDHASHALTNLRASVKEDGANCVGREDEFSGEKLPSDTRAELLCAGCNSFEKCEIFRLVGRPAFGVWAGKVQGRDLAKDD